MILLTGATGFLGRHMVDELLSQGYEVRLLVREAGHRTLPWEAIADIVEGDILDIESLYHAMEGVEYVVHAAACVSFWKKRHPQMMQVNVTGTANVVNACLGVGVKKLIHVSSTSALGKKSEKDLITEETAWTVSKKNSQYAVSKYKAELEVYRGIAEGLHAVIINPGVVIGPTNDWNRNTGKIFTLIHRGLRFYNRGASGFVGVKDVARAVALLLTEDVPNGSKYLLISENLTQKAILEQIAHALGQKPPAFALPHALSMRVAYVSQLLSTITGREPIITPESIRSSLQRASYDGSKITSLGLAYAPMKKVIEETAQAFLQDQEASGS